MTFTGTNTYLLGRSNIAVIDPGPDDERHLRAILDAARPGRIEKILVTHSHIDHTELVPRLAELTGAEVYAHESLGQVREQRENFNPKSGFGGGEGVDESFVPDSFVKDGEPIEGGGWRLETVWTPGHMHDHACFAWSEGRALFSGDHIMGWSTTVVSPPHGDMTAFMESLQRLKGRAETVYYPGHGGPVSEPQSMVRYQINHRKERERQILSEIGGSALSATELAHRIYLEVPDRLIPMAARSVFAHLLDLHRRKLVRAEKDVRFETRFYAV